MNGVASSLIEILKKVSSLSFVTLVPVFMLLLKQSIDYLNIRGVEKVLLTNSKRLIIQLSIICLIVLFYASIIGIFVYFTNDFKEEVLKDYRVYLVVTIIFTLFIVIPVYLVLMLLIKFISFKSKYYIHLEQESTKRWYISRRISTKSILMVDELGNYKFLEEPNLYNHTIYKVIQEKNARVLKYYLSIIKHSKLIYCFLILIITSVIGLSFSLPKEIGSNIKGEVSLFIITLICIFSIVVVKVISENMKHLFGASSSIKKY